MGKTLNLGARGSWISTTLMDQTVHITDSPVIKYIFNMISFLNYVSNFEYVQAILLHNIIRYIIWLHTFRHILQMVILVYVIAVGIVYGMPKLITSHTILLHNIIRFIVRLYYVHTFKVFTFHNCQKMLLNWFALMPNLITSHAILLFT